MWNGNAGACLVGGSGLSQNYNNADKVSLLSALLDTDTVIAVDCDRDALDTAKENAEQLEVEDRILFIQAQVATRPRATASASSAKKTPRGRKPQQQQKQADPLPPCTTGFPLPENCVDTVLTNPPFGTKHNQGMDVQFLELGCHLAKRAVYSFHKTSTRAFVLRTIEKKTGCPAKVVAEMKFDLGRTYKFHKNTSVDVDVDLIRVDMSQKPSASSSEEDAKGKDCDDT